MWIKQTCFTKVSSFTEYEEGLIEVERYGNMRDLCVLPNDGWMS